MRVWTALVCALLLCGCSNGNGRIATQAASARIGQAGGTITSLDGKLTLDIPAGALPQDTEITIRRLGTSELPPELADLPTAAAYELGPDGTQFAQPVAFEFAFDERPLQPDGGLAAEFVHLVTLSGGVLESVADGRILVDGNRDLTTGTGTLDHFSLVAVLKDAFTEEGLVSASLLGTVLLTRVGKRVTADLNVRATPFSEVRGLVEINVETRNLDDVTPMGDWFELSGGADVIGRRGEYDCTDTWDWSADVCFPPFVAAPFGVPIYEETAEQVMTFVSKNNSCSAAEPEEVVVFKPGVIGPEGLWAVLARYLGVAQTHLLVAACNGWLMLDPETGEVVYSRTFPGTPGQPLDPAFKVYLALNLARGLNIATQTAGPSLRGIPQQATMGEAVLSIGPTGYGVTGFDTDLGEFGLTRAGNNGAVDATHIGGDPSADVLIAGGGVRLMVFDGIFVESPDDLIPASAFPGAGSVFSAWRREPGGVTLVVTEGQSPGKIWKHEPGAAQAELVGELGEDPRKIRCATNIAVVSNFGSGSLTILTWDDDDNVAIAGTAAVGNAPIGIDVRTLDDGNVAVVSTGFSDNTYWITVIDPADGSVVANQGFPVPADGTGPGHAIWMPDGRIAISCHTSDSIVILTPTIPE